MNSSAIMISVCAMMLAIPALADPDDSILTTYEQNGLHQLDFKIGSTLQSGQAAQSASSLAYGYGVTDRWFSEVYVAYTRNGNDGTDFDSAAWQNTLNLTMGKFLIDAGIYTEMEYEADRSTGYKFTFGPLLQGEVGLTTWNLNLLFQRNYFANFANPMQMGYQWQISQHLNFPVDLGLQGFGQFGQWNRWAPSNQQTHRLGPAVFGKFALGGHESIHYNVAMLFDEFDQQHATTLRAQAVYGF